MDASLQADLQALQAAVEQVQDARYADLERHLRNGQWEEADNETQRLMITEVGKEEGQWFDPDDLSNFPCEPLRTINGLWVKYSGGKFGFSVQRRMYIEKCGGVANGRYDRRALWNLAKMNGCAEELKFDITSPEGHLPSDPEFFWDKPMSGFSFLVYRLVSCKL